MIQKRGLAIIITLLVIATGVGLAQAGFLDIFRVTGHAGRVIDPTDLNGWHEYICKESGSDLNCISYDDIATEIDSPDGYWTKTGNDISYTDGKVSTGPLEIDGDLVVGDFLYVNPEDDGSYNGKIYEGNCWDGGELCIESLSNEIVFLTAAEKYPVHVGNADNPRDLTVSKNLDVEGNIKATNLDIVSDGTRDDALYVKDLSTSKYGARITVESEDVTHAGVRSINAEANYFAGVSGDDYIIYDNIADDYKVRVDAEGVRVEENLVVIDNKWGKTTDNLFGVSACPVSGQPNDDCCYRSGADTNCPEGMYVAGIGTSIIRCCKL